ncbi:MAG: PEP-CTERM sorting domain-containing protein, partial [bacterium]|nr:PEP-CTERM sorting domain-containing protein [bacterium]
ADGSRSIGTFTFNALQEGQTALAIWESEATSWGPFSSISGTLDVQYAETDVIVGPANVVPEPGTGVLLAFGIVGLAVAGGTRRDSRRNR